MTSASNLKELFELKESWSKQGFVYTNEQKKRYDELLKLRRERVKSFYENDKVFKGASSKQNIGIFNIRMKTFREFNLICEAIYDKDKKSDVDLEVGKIGAERKKTAPEKRRVKAAGGGKTKPAKDYKPRKDIGQQRQASTRVQQPEKKRGTASLSPREQQRKAALERRAAKSGGKSNKKELEKKATALLSKRAKKTVDPNYKPPKASGYTKKERRQIRRQGSKLVTHLQKGIDKPASVYKPKEV